MIKFAWNYNNSVREHLLTVKLFTLPQLYSSLFAPYPLCVKVRAPRAAVARPCGKCSFDRSLMPPNGSDPLAALRSDRRNRLLMCEAAFSCYDNVSGTGGT